MDTNQRTCLLYRSFIVLQFSTTLPWLIRVLLVNKGCRQLEINLSRYFWGVHQEDTGGLDLASRKLSCTGLWEWHAWPALSVTLSGQLQKLLHFYWNVSILPWKYGRGCGQGNKQLYTKSNRLLAKNKSRRANEWRVRLTKNAWFLDWDCQALTYWGNNCIMIVDDFPVLFWVFYSFQRATKTANISKDAMNSVVEKLLNEKIRCDQTKMFFQWAIDRNVEEYYYSKSIFWWHSACRHFSHNLSSFTTIS